MNTPPARLVVRRGPTGPKEFPLTAGTFTIGREAQNEIVINDPEVSRRHARLVYEAGGHTIEDLGSTNGTYVNGLRIAAPTRLRQGDTIDLGESVNLAYFGPGADLGATVLEPAAGEIGAPTMLDYGGFPATRPEPVRAQFHQPAAEALALQTADVQSLAPRQPAGRSRRRLFIGCGCLLFLAVVACGASLFLLDLYAPDVLYCGPLKPLLELAGLVPECV